MINDIYHLNRIGDVMGSMLTLSAVTIKFVFVASPLSTQHSGDRAKTGWLGIRIMCPSGTTCLSADCCFNKLAL
jgi:hypothetical protein